MMRYVFEIFLLAHYEFTMCSSNWKCFKADLEFFSSKRHSCHLGAVAFLYLHGLHTLDIFCFHLVYSYLIMAMIMFVLHPLIELYIS